MRSFIVVAIVSLVLAAALGPAGAAAHRRFRGHGHPQLPIAAAGSPATQTPKTKAVRGEIQIPSIFVGGSTPTGAPVNSQSIAGTQLRSIPHPDPYWGRVRELQRIIFPWTALMQTFKPEEAPAFSAFPPTMAITFQLFRSGSLAWQEEIIASNVVGTYLDSLGGSRRFWAGLLSTDFVNPIPVLAGQSLDWRAQMAYVRTEAADKAGLESVHANFNVGGVWTGANIENSPGIITYIEHPAGRDPEDDYQPRR
jgi:hypothetical protein